MGEWPTFLIVGGAILGGGLAAGASLGRLLKVIAAERQSLLYWFELRFHGREHNCVRHPGVRGSPMIR